MTQTTATGAFQLPPLPWKDDALAPHISAETISFHYGKHHKAYLDNLNNLVKDKPYATMTLEQVVLGSAKNPADAISRGITVDPTLLLQATRSAIRAAAPTTRSGAVVVVSAAPD